MTLVLSFISALFCLLGNTGRLELLALLPIFWGVANLLMPKKLYMGTGLTMMNLVLSIRYIIYPIVVTMSPSFLNDIDSTYLMRGIVLMLLEIIVIVLTVKVYHNKKGVKAENFKRPEGNRTVLFPLIGIGILIYCIIYKPSVFVNRHLIFNAANIQNEVILGDGVISQFESWAEFFVVLWLFWVLSQRYQKTRSKTAFILSLAIISIPCLFFSGHSRLSLLMPLVATVFFLYKCYGIKARTYSIALIAGGVVILFFMSLWKVFGDNYVNQSGDLFSAESLDAYFGGLNNICIGLKAYDSFGSSPAMFVVDTFRNAMGISKNFSLAQNTTELFNTIVYGFSSDSNDQIVPTVVQGLLYFGKLFWWIPTVIMVLVVCFTDHVFASTSDFSIAYLFANFPVVVGWAIPGNYTHLASRFFNYLVPILLIICIRSIISKSILRH